MFVKKVIHTFRNRVVTLVQLLLPVIFTILALVVAKIAEYTEPSPELVLNSEPFSSNVVPYTMIPAGNAEVTAMANSYGDFADRAPSSARLVDVTGSSYSNLSDFYLTDGDSLDVYSYNKRFIFGAVFQGAIPLLGMNQTTVVGYFSAQPYHAAPVSLNLVMNAFFRYFTSSSRTIVTSNYPLPSTADNLAASNGGVAFSVAFNILFGLAFLATSFIIFLIKERETQSKHVQTVSGVHVITFWAANFVWDFINFLIPVGVLLVVFAAFQTEAYVLDNRLGLVLLLFLTYGWAILPFMYLLHFLFKTPSSGMAALTMANIGTGKIPHVFIRLLFHDVLKVSSLLFDGSVLRYCMIKIFVTHSVV